jgi:CheY-like chemotaxis protein
MARILIVDDDKIISDVYGLYLGNAGHSAIGCLGGAEAIRSILTDLPDVVLLDLCMPHLNGFELLKAIKGDPISKSIPVVVLSSRSDHKSVERATQLGAADFLFKPVRGKRLVEVINQVLDLGTPPA